MLTQSIKQAPTRRHNSKPIQRTGDATPALVEHMRIDHGRRHIRMAEQLLHRANVVTAFKQVGRKRMAAMPNSA